jgi:demethylmenaquinone methyltransferase / 2-methoxy-6-polyprenyl-1,4-benzoquinol methylase
MLGRPPAPAEDVRDTTPTPPSPATPDLPDASSRGAESHSSRSDASDQERRPARANRVSPDVAALFDEIAPVYDRLSSVLSLWRDGRWRSAAVEATGVRAGDSTIDVAAGTGKLAAALADRVGPFGRVVAVDLSPAMVERGRHATRDIVQLEFVVGDAMALDFDDARFEAATIGFALRVMPDPAAVLAELRRVVRPGGRVVCLEPTTPRPRWWGRIYDAGVHRLAPVAGTAAGRRGAYRRMAASVSNVGDARALVALMGGAGLVDIRHRGLWLGGVSLCVGTVPAG